MKALIKVGDRCNQACRFCHRGAPGRIDVPRARVDALIDRAAALGHDTVVLSGGEATLRPELVAWAERAAARGVDFGLVTNGALLDAAIVEALVARRLRYVHLSLHGGTRDVHDGIVGARSFDRVLRALGVLAARGLELWVNCVVVRDNLGVLRGVADAVAPFDGAGLKYSFVEARGGAGRALDAVVPSLTEAAPRIADALAHARRALGDERPLGHDGVPLCLLGELGDLRGDLRAHGFVSMAEVGEADLHPIDELNALHPDRCGPCPLKGRCPGLYLGYHARHGDAELRPAIGRARSNSFNYVYEGRVAMTAGGERCPVAALGVTPWDRARHLFVRHGDRIGRFRADTRDFADSEIADVKRRAGQLYLDASGREAPDDFAAQLVKLRPVARCASCSDSATCTGLYEAAPENQFVRDDARVLELLATLEGEVLDVGCGEGRYAHALAAAAQAGRLRYVGLEPDRARADRLRADWPWARVEVGTAEEFPLAQAGYDHVLVLRSWNHLRDPARATARLVAAVRPGGTLTIVDNEAFGLARARAHAARAERSGAGFEHYRNDTAGDAHRVVAGVAPGLRLVERRDVGPATSNQWLLRYVVEGAAAC